MEQRFQLKEYGSLSLFEQDQMTAEERSWYMKRLEKEYKDKQEKEKNATSRMPSIPRARRR